MNPRGLSIRWLLLGANAIALTLPVLAFFGLRVYDTYLLRQTERQLIAQAVMAGELWREALAEKRPGLLAQSFRPPNDREARFVPIAPRIDLGAKRYPPQPVPAACAHLAASDIQEAAKQVLPLLKRAQVFNLSAIRLIDSEGCVVASTGAEEGLSLQLLPEVRRALAGRYSAVTRMRISDEPTPPLVDIRRRGNIRVFSALPVFAGDEVIGVVRISRTSLSAMRSLWLNRRGLMTAALSCGMVLVLLTLLFTKAITRPLRRLQADAKAIAEGATTSGFTQKAWTPVEFKALAKSLAAMTEKLRERAEYTSAYAANVTHELKTPITAIRGAAELLRDDLEKMQPEQRQRFLNNIEADARRMERLVNRLLDLTRIENAVVSRPDDTIDVRAFLEQLQSRNPDRVTLKLSALEPLVMNADRFASVITNLVDNALEKSPSTRVEIAATHTDGRLLLKVSDDGPTIPPEHLPQIFERFFTTKGDEGGTGLGLALVKAIAEARGGKASVTSGEGRTEFSVSL